jgi:purine nucleoside phosphorylase
MRRCAAIAVIGGTGPYSLPDGGEQLEVDAPCGPPTSPIMVHEIGGPQVAFLAGHGETHQYPAPSCADGLAAEGFSPPQPYKTRPRGLGAWPGLG